MLYVSFNLNKRMCVSCNPVGTLSSELYTYLNKQIQIVCASIQFWYIEWELKRNLSKYTLWLDTYSEIEL